jgi:hypothetical protein
MRELESGEYWHMEYPTIRKIDVEEVDVLWRLDILEIFATSLLERSTVYDPAFTRRMCWIRMRIQEMRAAPTCVSSPRSRSPLKLDHAVGQSMWPQYFKQRFDLSFALSRHYKNAYSQANGSTKA